MMYTSLISGILEYLPWALFSALRAYALSSKSFFLAFPVFLLSIAPLVINYVAYGLRSTVLLNNEVFTIASRTSLIVSDILVLLITWIRTHRTSVEMQSLGQPRSLSTILLRDGVIHFIIIVVRNTLHLIFNLLYFRTTSVPMNSARNITSLSQPIAAIIVSRFLIHLQEASKTMAPDSLCSTEPSGLSFARLMTSLQPSLSTPGEPDDARDPTPDIDVVDC
ncbi:hypothetical protein C8Q76DRAFT_369825 [Earliella scabrosa]|nr:hypothetical protein C8Q76DRAFT_369825 [Earliella scabrosa]